MTEAATSTTEVTDTLDNIEVTLELTTPEWATDDFEIDVGIETTSISDSLNVAIVLDTSGSTGGSSGSDVDGDGDNDTYLEAQVFAAEALFQSFVDAGYDTSSVTITLVEFNSGAETVGTYSLSDFTSFSDDLNDLNSGSTTNYGAGLSEVMTEWADTSTDDDPNNDVTQDTTNVIYFMSDGEPYGSAADKDGEDAAADLVDNYDATIISIAVGTGASTDELDDLDTTSSGVTVVTDASQIADLVTSPAETADFEYFEIYVDGVLYETVPITDDRVTSDVSGYSLDNYEITGYDYTVGGSVQVSVTGYFDDGSDVLVVSDVTIPLTICFVNGTHILTNIGLRKIENLSQGDMITTRDNGLQPIRWIGSTQVTPKFAASNPRLRPIVIRANAYGDNIPISDLRVSRQHRFVLSGWKAELMYGEVEVFVPAHTLKNDLTIVEEIPKETFSYYHILFDQHEIIYAEGVETESFHPTKSTIEAMTTAQKDELFMLFPELESLGSAESLFETSLMQIKGHEAMASMLH